MNDDDGEDVLRRDVETGIFSSHTRGVAAGRAMRRDNPALRSELHVLLKDVDLTRATRDPYDHTRQPNGRFGPERCERHPAQAASMPDLRLQRRDHNQPGSSNTLQKPPWRIHYCDRRSHLRNKLHPTDVRRDVHRPIRFCSIFVPIRSL